MKKILLTAVLAVSALAASAQVWVGGSLGYLNESVKNGYTNPVTGVTSDLKTNTFEIAPEVGYVLNDKVDLAIALGFSTSKADYDGAKADTHFSVNPYVRYTFFQTGAVGFFLDGGFKIRTSNGKYMDGTTEKNDPAEFKIGIRPGVKFAASDKVTFVAKLGWIGYTANNANIKSNNDFGIGVDGRDLTFGVYYTF